MLDPSFLGAVNTSIIPSVADTYDLGSPTYEWANIYIGATGGIHSDSPITFYDDAGTSRQKIQVSELEIFNGLGSPSMTSNPGEFVTTDIMNIGSLKVGGTEVIDSAGMVDGVDVSAFKSDYDSKIDQAVKTTSSPTFGDTLKIASDANRYGQIKRSGDVVGNLHIDTYYAAGDTGGNLYLNWYSGKSLIYGGGAELVKFKIDVDGNITTVGTVDGVDISAFKTDYDSKINQAVKTTSTPRFAQVNIGSDCNLYRADANLLKTNNAFYGKLKLITGVSANPALAHLLQVSGTCDDIATVFIRNYSSASRGLMMRLANPTDYLIYCADGVLNPLFKVDASGNITTVGTVDGVDVSAHATTKDAHQKFISPFKDDSLQVSRTTQGSVEDTSYLMTGYTAMIPTRISWSKVITGTATFYIYAQLNTGDWVELFSTPASGSGIGNVEEWEITNKIGAQGKYIKNIKISLTVGADSQASASATVYGWQQ